MKKSLITLLIFASSCAAYAQDEKSDLVRSAADLKSGASQDVLASFFRLGFKDIKDGHQFQFSSSLFAIKAKTNEDLLTDINYKKQTFARNFVFGFGLSADSVFHFKDLSVHAKYAIINNRDKDLFLYSPELDPLLNQTSLFLKDSRAIYRKQKPTTKEMDLAYNYYYRSPKGERTPFNKLPANYQIILQTLQKDPAYNVIAAIPLDKLPETVGDIVKKAGDLMQQRSLWTAGAQMTAGKQQFFNRGNLNSEYLKGMTKSGKRMGLELDIKADIDFYDSVSVSQAFHRSVLSSSAGINWIIYKSKATEKSYVEFKPALTYNNVLGGLLPGETRTKFTGDGVLRFRITDDLWLPIDIKYDPDAKKIFGFLNITANFDWLGKKTKS